MATNNANSDIEILVGVQGGESISEGSGQLIGATLKKIAAQISQQQLIKVTVGADLRTSKNSIQKTLNQADVKIHNIGFGENVSSKLQGQLAKMGFSIDIDANLKESEKKDQITSKKSGSGGTRTRKPKDIDYLSQNEKTADKFMRTLSRISSKNGEIVMSAERVANAYVEAEDAVNELASSSEKYDSTAIGYIDGLIDRLKTSVSDEIREQKKALKEASGSSDEKDWSATNEKFAKGRLVELEAIRKLSKYNISDVSKLNKKYEEAVSYLNRIGSMDVEPTVDELSNAKKLVTEYRNAVNEYTKLQYAASQTPSNDKYIDSRLKRLAAIRSSVNFDIGDDAPDGVKSFVSETESELNRLEGIVKNAANEIASIPMEPVDEQIDLLANSVSSFGDQQKSFEAYAEFQTRCVENQNRITDALSDSGESFSHLIEFANQFEYADNKNVEKVSKDILSLNTEIKKLDGLDDTFKFEIKGEIVNKDKITSLYDELLREKILFASRSSSVSDLEIEEHKRKESAFNDYVKNYVKGCDKIFNASKKASSGSTITVKNSQNQSIVDSQLKKLNNAIVNSGAVAQTDAVQKKYAELKAEIQKCADSAEAYGIEQEIALRRAIASINDVIKEQRKLAKESSPDSRNAATVRSEDALANFDKYLKTLNPKALTECSAEIENIKRLLQENTPAAFKQAELAIKSFKAQMKNMGYEGGNILTFLEGKIKTFAVYLISSELTNKFVETLAKVGSTVIELDAALTDLRIVTGSTKDAAKELLATYNEMAQELGATTVATAQSAVEWQRQGYNIQDTNELIKDSMVLSVVGMVDSADAAQYLTSAVKGYKVEVSDAMGIVDKLTAVDLKAAVSAGGLAEAMARTANSARQAGVDMNSLIGYIAAVGEVTQRDMATVGEAFKTIFARYGNVKLGKLVDDESGDSLNDFETALNAVGIALRNQEGQFRDFNDVMVDLGKTYQTLSDTERSAIATTLGGVRQRENVLVLLENLDKAFGYAETAATSAGTAMQKFSVYEESVEHSAQKMAAAFERFSSWTIDSSLIAGVYELAAAALNAASTFPSWIKDLVAFNAALLAASAAVKSFNASTLGESFRKTFKDLGWPKKTGDIVPIYSKKAA